MPSVVAFWVAWATIPGQEGARLLVQEPEEESELQQRQKAHRVEVKEGEDEPG